jgi:hypothetical protein
VNLVILIFECWSKGNGVEKEACVKERVYIPMLYERKSQYSS